MLPRRARPVQSLLGGIEALTDTNKACPRAGGSRSSFKKALGSPPAPTVPPPRKTPGGCAATALLPSPHLEATVATTRRSCLMKTHVALPVNQRLSQARRRSLVLALAGGAALASLSARAQPAPGKGDILIGRSTALSGGMAPFLAPIHEGQDAAVEDANAKGGIGGRKIRLVTLDDGFDPRRTLENARQLSEKEGVLALLGVSGTSQVMALHPYLFTTRASYADELVKIVRNLVAVQTSRIAVAYENNDFGKLLLPLVEKTIAAEGATLAGSHAIAPTGADAHDAAKPLAAQKPQAVLLVAAGPPVVAYVRANRAHLGVPVYTLSLGAGSAVLKALGDDARGLAVARTGPSPTKTSLALTRDFQAYLKRHDKPVDYDRYTGYMDARVLIEGLRAAGPGVTRASLVQAM